MTLSMAKYINGAIKVKVSGHMPEKFINLCVAQNILLWGINKSGSDLFVWMFLNDFYTIRAIARKSRTRVSIIKRYGLPFTVKRLKKRKILLIGPVIFFIVLNVLASYIWFVDVIGIKNLRSDRVKEIAYSQGLKPGAMKNNINSKHIENEILVNLPEVAWVGVTFSGTRAVVEVVEKNIAKPEDKSPAHIVAAKDGIITEAIILAGQSTLKKGDTVKRGDLLIKGFIPEQITSPTSADQPPIISVPQQLIKAKGIVKARVWYESYGESELVKAIHERTGEQQVSVILKIGSNEIVLKNSQQEQFKLYDTEVIHKKLPRWRNSDFVVESIINIFHELEEKTSEITLEEARDQAKSKALETVQRNIPETANILSRNIELINTSEPNLVRVKVTIEAEEEIGQSIVISQQ
ncbi:sporulation protein YqfD [Dendrosporobacter sp. 1207_IL3150]|uniref:sporulation protein YqfD n=1 Tax=Dendrosporobacter sp. 1207_IL3150 TaxID=3084054 RepID=UPI002FD8ACF5